MGNSNSAQRRPSGGSQLSPKPSTRQFVPPVTTADPLFSQEELKSVRLIATQGPFVDFKTGERLSRFYMKHAPEKNTPENISHIIESGMEVRMLNSKLKDKYGFDLDDLEAGIQDEI